MARYEMLTKSGYNFYDMASALQKGIRRGDFNLAGVAARELLGKYNKYLWKRLLIISAEDCYGIMTKEIVALYHAYQECEGGKGEGGGIFVAKAVMLLCMALKNRDACYFACNFMNDEATINPEDIPVTDFSDCSLLDDKIPDYVYDCHTLKGKRSGKTVRDMIIDEQEALQPKQMGLFDDADWAPFLKTQNLPPVR